MSLSVKHGDVLILAIGRVWKAAQDPADRDDGTGAGGIVPGDIQRRGAERVTARDFDALTDRYYKSVFNVIFQWIGDYDEAADLTQETFASAYKAIGRFRGEAKVYTWLYQIAHNHCKNRFKQRDRLRGLEGPSLDIGITSDADGGEGAAAPVEVADWTYSPSELFEQKELRALIDSAVNSLASEYKVVLILREMEGLSYNEIAEVTGLTMEAVKTRLNRARAMVRRKVEPYYRP